MIFKEINAVKLIIRSVEFDVVRDFVFPPSLQGFYFRPN